MSGWAKPGVKCQCIIDAWFNIEDNERPLIKKGDVLEIDGVDVHKSVGVILSFVGLPKDHWYNVQAFRPLHTVRRDVRAIKSMLRELPAETRLDRLLEALDE